MIERINIILKWCFFNGLLFYLLSLAIYPVAAAVISMIITVGAATHPTNSRDINILKRPIIYVRQING